MGPTRYGSLAHSALIAFAFGFVALLGTIASAASATAAGLTVSPSSVAFGNVVVGTTSPAQAVFANNGSNGAIQFERIVVASAPFLSVGTTCNGSLSDGQTCRIDVACKPTALGTFTGTLTFFSNKDQKNIVNLTCTGVNPTPKVSISGAAIQNGMNGAAITAVSVNADGSDGSTLATATANSNGQFSIVVSPPQNGPVRLRASGGSYVSEQNGATISSPSPLSVLLPNLQSNLAGLSINPLTTFVDSLAQGNISRGQNLATALSNSTASIEHDYGISTDPSTLTPLYAPAAVGTDAGRLGLILGAIVNEDQLACPYTHNPGGGLVSALSSDISDGVFDGMNGGTPVSYCGAPLPAIAGTAQFSDALSGLQQMTLAPGGFTFGGTNNALSLNGVTAAEAASDAATIETALFATLPPSVNTFAATTPSMNTARNGATATLLPNGRVLIAGGYNGGTSSLSSTDLYDPATNTFAASTPSMHIGRDGATATLLPNGNVLIAGGSYGFSALQIAELYNWGSNSFPSTVLMNMARAGATATLLPNGMVLIAGGVTNGGPLPTTVELYDTASGTFVPPTAASPPPSMNAGRYAATATLLPNGKVLIAGGADLNAGYLDSTELYDSATNTFAPQGATPVMNTPRRSATATLLPNGKVLIAGGWNTNSHIDLSSTELYDPAANTFAPPAATPVMNTARDQATATLLPNGKVLIAGGEAIGAIFSSTELYDPGTNSFAASTPMMNAARNFTAAIVLLPNGKVLIAGGYDNNVSLSSIELYTP
jgi:Galactose oxidase, central domain/Abnormal spindle-like microcephaly-assoc'd, ASPM-SPD-2-Hydin